MKKSLSGALRVTVGVLLAGWSAMTPAQETASQSGPGEAASTGGIQEVIVTALKRDTSRSRRPFPSVPSPAHRWPTPACRT